MATGVRPLTAFQLGKETVAGTAVATTRELYPSVGSGFDTGTVVAHHEGAARGTFANVTHGTVLQHAPVIAFTTEDSHGATFDDLIYVGGGLDSGQTGSGTTADKTWAFSSDQTAHTFETYTANIYDGQQAYEVEYCFPVGASITMGDATGLTQFSLDMVGRQVSKVSLDSVSANNAVKIDNAGWTLKYATAQSGLTGASALANTLRSFTLNLSFPQRAHFYGDGNLYFGQGLASAFLEGTLSMVWDATDDAEVQWDRYQSQSVSFFRLRNTGPTLGSSAYQASFDVAVLWEDVNPGSGEIDGVMTTDMTGKIVYDPSWGDAIQLDLINSLAAIP
jgi:hypothetical protein